MSEGVESADDRTLLVDDPDPTTGAGGAAGGEGQSSRSVVERFDDLVDARFAPLRRSAAANRVFYFASAVGDDGRLWLGLATVETLRGPVHRRHEAIDLAAWLGIESAIVNGPMKWATRRRRPVRGAGDHPHRLRKPGTSSFPSGHAASAFTMATMLARQGGLGYLWFAPATVIAVSRIHTRMHHASDVAAGAAVGIGIGLLGRRVPITEPLARRLKTVPGLGWLPL